MHLWLLACFSPKWDNSFMWLDITKSVFPQKPSVWAKSQYNEHHLCIYTKWDGWQITYFLSSLKISLHYYSFECLTRACFFQIWVLIKFQLCLVEHINHVSWAQSVKLITHFIPWGFSIKWSAAHSWDGVAVAAWREWRGEGQG